MSKVRNYNTKDAENKPVVTWTDLTQEQKNILLDIAYFAGKISKYTSVPKIAETFGTTKQNLHIYKKKREENE